MGYTIEEIGHKLDHMEEELEAVVEDELQEHCKEHHKHKDGKDMDIAGLLALMQSNKNLDLPGILALCKEKGVDQSFGGGGSFLLIVLLLFLFMGGGGMGNYANRNAVAAAVGEGECQRIIDILDAIRSSQDVTMAGFSKLDTSLCTSIANVISAVRDQGDRSEAGMTALSRQVSECCCSLTSKLDTIMCAINGISNKLDTMNTNLTGKIELSNERMLNRIDKMEANMNLGFERQACLITSLNKDNEIARLTRENCAMREERIADRSVERTVGQLEHFMVKHYTPTASA